MALCASAVGVGAAVLCVWVSARGGEERRIEEEVALAGEASTGGVVTPRGIVGGHVVRHGGDGRVSGVALCCGDVDEFRVLWLCETTWLVMVTE